MCGLHQLSRLLISGSLLLAISLPAASIAQTSLRQQMDTLAAATSLDRNGIHAWHMRLSFDLFDLNGKPQESGTIEEWWAGPDHARIVITSPSFNQTLPGDDLVVNSREAYLVHLLLSEVVHPMIRGNADQYDATVATQPFGQTTLSCTSLNLKKMDNPMPSRFCVAPATGELRLTFFEGVRSDALNDVSSAMDTQIAMRHAIAFAGRPAIKGHIESIEPFDPAPTNLQLGPIAPLHDTSQTGPRILTRISPTFPQGRSGGVVVLHTHILPNGKLGTFETVTSTAPFLTDAATNALSQWRYTPLKHHGVPSECDTTITIAFLPPNESNSLAQVLISEEDGD